MVRARILVMLMILVVMLGSAPASRAIAAIEIGSVGATANFPSGISFDISASASRPIVKAELLYTKAEVETLNLVSATVNPGKTVTITLPVDFRANYLPPGIDITYHWRLT